MFSTQNHKYISLGFGVVFAVLIWWFASPVPVFRFLVPGFLLYLLILTLYNWRYLLATSELDWWQLARIAGLVTAWFGLLFIIPAGFAKAVFLVLSIILVFFFETLIANKGQQLAWNSFLVSLAAIFLTIFGFNFYFPLSGLVYLSAIFISVLLLVRASIENVPHSSQIKWVCGLVLGLFAAQLFWALQFLPLHFSVLAVMEFTALYLVWAIYYHYLYQTLTAKQLQFNVILVVVLNLLILLSSPWTIQS